ncbi:MAG TPA: inositol monophosphatase family protein [Burkholderiales bacterium]|nr:inositol monophosphatase family protein [Burkholderiales bacterium]
MTMRETRKEIPSRDLERFRALALRMANEARTHLLALQKSGFEVQRKPDGSYVTSADFQTEQALRALVEQEFPQHGIVGEEFPARLPEAEFQWIFDPVDGTEDFVTGIPNFGTIIGLHFRGQPLIGVIDVPMLDVRVHAAYGLGAFRGQRRLQLPDLEPGTPTEHVRTMLAARANFAKHGAWGDAHFDRITRAYPNHRIYRTCFAHCCTAFGQTDVMIEYGNKIWDLAAAQILLEEAGGRYHVIQRLDAPGGAVLAAVFGKPKAVADVIALLG